MEKIFVYKTNASVETDLAPLKELLNDNRYVISWNFDFDDCDKVFRLVSKGISKVEVMEILAFCNIQATELV